MNIKTNTVNEEFDLLLKSGIIAFYKSCEITQFYIIDKRSNEVANFYTLFVFEELECPNEISKFLFKAPISIGKNHSLRAIQKRISIEKAKHIFYEIQQGRLDIEEPCKVSPQTRLLPKAFLPRSLKNDAFVNRIIKKNVWGCNYIIEFFNENKIFNLGDQEREFVDYINAKIKEVCSIDLASVYDRIGNIIFQFPITLAAINVDFTNDNLGAKILCKPHHLLSEPKNICMQIQTYLDNVITGFDIKSISGLDFEIKAALGDDNNIHVTISDVQRNLLLYDENDINRLKSVQSDFHIINSDEPRTIPQRDGSEIKIQTHDSFISIIGDESHGKDYQSQIISRSQNNEILMHSDDYHVFKYNQKEKALNFIRTKIKQHSHIKEICLWDPYLSAYDIMDTLYYEPTGIKFRCISSVSKANNANNAPSNSSSNRGFEIFRHNNQSIFKKSNNKKINLKFLAQHDYFGWKFHDRFLIFVPSDTTKLPEVYSLGTSVNQIGMHHHIIQKVTNPREILNNFEELWKQLDNDECCVVDYPKMLGKI